MQHESCSLGGIQYHDSVGTVSRISRIPHFARLLSGGVFPINVAKTAKASLDMTAAVVDAAPFSRGRASRQGWALTGSLVIHAALFGTFSMKAQPPVLPAMPVIMAALIAPAQRSGSATEASSKERPVAVPSRIPVSTSAPVVTRKPVTGQVEGRQLPLETTPRPELLSPRGLSLPSQAPSPVRESGSGGESNHSGGPDSAAGGGSVGKTAGGPGIAQGVGDGPLTPARFDAGYLNNPAPPYPARARRLGEEGKVILRVWVSSEGSAEEVAIKASSGSVRLDESALQTVRRWQFIPARRGSDIVASWVLVPVLFRLEQ